MTHRRLLAAALVACGLAGAALAAPADKAAQAQAAWRRGWEAYALYLDPYAHADRQARSAKLEEAGKLLAQAAGLQPDRGVYAEAAGYLALQLAKYPDAQKHLTRAKQLAGKEPRVRLLLGQVFSSNLQGTVDQARTSAKKALEEFKAAARLDKDNANASLTSSSMLVDAGFDNWGLYLAQALAMKELRLYLLPLPEGMPAAAALRIQYQFCGSQAARVLNVARFCWTWASEEPSRRQEWLRKSQEVCSRLERAQPALAGLVMAAVATERQAEELLVQAGGGAAARVEQLKGMEQALVAPAQAVPGEKDTVADYLAAQAEAAAAVLETGANRP